MSVSQPETAPVSDTKIEELEGHVQRLENLLDLRKQEIEILSGTVIKKDSSSNKGGLLKESAVWIAIIGLLGTAVNSGIQGWANYIQQKDKQNQEIRMQKEKQDGDLALENSKQEASLILESVKAETEQDRASRLLFLIKAGKIHLKDTDQEKAIEIAANGQTVPSAPASSTNANGISSVSDPLVGQIRFERLEGGAVRLLDDWEKKNLVDVTIPQLRGAKLLGEDKSFSGTLRFNRIGVNALKHVWEEAESSGIVKNGIIQNGNRTERLSFDGSYTPRLVHGSNSTLSNSTKGLLIYINAEYNPTGVKPPDVGQPGSVRVLVPLFEKYGFRWGGNYARPCGMIFEYTGRGKDGKAR
jgi:hypothetical protein